MKKVLACKQFLFSVILTMLFPLIFSNVIFGTSAPNPEATATDPNLYIVDFTDPIKLSTSDSTYAHHVETCLAITDDDLIYAGWKNSETFYGGGARNSFTTSSDLGETWSNHVFMPLFNTSLSRQSDPWMIHYGNTLFYCYLEFENAVNGWSIITVAKTTNQGVDWDLVQASNGDHFADKQTIAVDSNENLFMVYDDVDTSETYPSYVRLTRSLDAGATFEEVSVIADTVNHTDSHLAPYIAIDSNDDIHVVWLWFTTVDWGDVYHVKSTDQGEIFTGYTDINPLTENGTYQPSGVGSAMKITLPVVQFDDNDRMYVLYAEPTDMDDSWGIFLRYSDDYGTTFSSRHLIHQDPAGDEWQPDMTIDENGILHFIFTEEDDGEYRTYYRAGYFTDTAFITGEEIPLTSFYTTSAYWRPGEYNTIRLTSDGIPHIVFTASNGDGMDVFYVKGLLHEIVNGGLTPTNLALAIVIPSVVVIATVVTIIIIVRKKKI